jgi:pyrroline-5-carboxylate reductase
MKKPLKISIIGAGSMGGAIARAVVSSKKPWSLTVINSSKEKLATLKKAHKNLSISTGYESLFEADVVVLAVKPQSFADLSLDIKPLLSKNVLVVSIMAGRSVKNIQRLLGVERVIHAMPNLGAQFGESMTVWTGSALTKADMTFAHAFFAVLGEELYVTDEDMVNKTTAVSASGIGFMTYMIEAYITETERLGFTKEEASTMVLQTLRATNTLLQKKERTPAEIRTAVTSKKGTTEAGLKILMRKQFSKILGDTLKKAYKRACVLSE